MVLLSKMVYYFHELQIYVRISHYQEKLADMIWCDIFGIRSCLATSLKTLELYCYRLTHGVHSFVFTHTEIFCHLEKVHLMSYFVPEQRIHPF